MTANSARLDSAKNAPGLVVFVVYPDIVLLDLAGPLQAFSQAIDPVTQSNGYECVVACVDGTLTQTNTVGAILSTPMSCLSRTPVHLLVVVGGDGAIPALRDTKLVATVQALGARAQRMSSVCSGALIPAVTGF